MPGSPEGLRIAQDSTGPMMTQAVFFDLDGTFADTAPDLAYALDRMRSARSLPPVPLSVTRPVTSMGARGILSAGFGVTPEDPGYEALRKEFLRFYEENLCRETRVFAGMDALLTALHARGVRWGIVTNKAERYAKPLIAALRLDRHCDCIIGGDTTGHLKPHPAPLLAACSKLGVSAAECIYVGDDERDVQAGRAAGMRTVAVRYGYLNGGTPDRWGADGVIDQPQDLLDFL